MVIVRFHLQERDSEALVVSLCGLVNGASLCPGVGQSMDYTHVSWLGAVIMVALSLVLEDRERHCRSEKMVPPTISFASPSFRVSCDLHPLMLPLPPKWRYI